MTIQQIADLIESFGLPYRMDHFESEPVLPYCVYYFPNSNDFFADSINYVERVPLHIEIFTKDIDLELERTISATLNQNNISFYKSRDFLNDEKIYQITFESEVIINV